jgi:hypothetical protein
LKHSIEVTIEEDGAVKIEAKGFQGADCDKATKFLEEALGTVGSKRKKPEHAQTAPQQRKATL